jgi:hypothetical protein
MGAALPPAPAPPQVAALPASGIVTASFTLNRVGDGSRESYRPNGVIPAEETNALRGMQFG